MKKTLTKKILFVCSGNTCRSPMAEGLFKKHIADKGITDIEVGSAGLSAFSGDTVSENSVTVLKNRGIDISSHRAKRVNHQMLLETDLFVCMSPSHAWSLAGLCENERIMVLGIDDPYMQDASVYEQCCEQIEKILPQILKKITSLPVIRPMTGDDVKSIAALEKQCFSEPWSEKSLSDELNNPTARFFTLSNGGEIMGYIGANNICGEVYITNVAVNEKYRKRGYGHRLVHYLITHSAIAGAEFITLEVRQSNENAIKLYEKCGFEKMGERKDFYRNPKENAFIYTIDFKKYYATGTENP